MINNRVFISFDGDKIGEKFQQFSLDENVKGLSEMSQKLQEGNDIFRQFAEEHGGHVITIGGDSGSLAFDADLDESDLLPAIDQIRQMYQELTGTTVSVGIGRSLSTAAQALMNAKENGKNQISVFSRDAGPETEEAVESEDMPEEGIEPEFEENLEEAPEYEEGVEPEYEDAPEFEEGVEPEFEDAPEYEEGVEEAPESDEWQEEPLEEEFAEEIPENEESQFEEPNDTFYAEGHEDQENQDGDDYGDEYQPEEEYDEEFEPAYDSVNQAQDNSFDDVQPEYYDDDIAIGDNIGGDLPQSDGEHQNARYYPEELYPEEQDPNQEEQISNDHGYGVDEQVEVAPANEGKYLEEENQEETPEYEEDPEELVEAVAENPDENNTEFVDEEPFEAEEITEEEPFEDEEPVELNGEVEESDAEPIDEAAEYEEEPEQEDPVHVEDYSQEEGVPEEDDESQFQAFHDMLEEENQQLVQDMKSQVATTLEQFKGVKDQLQSIEQQAPELYTGVLAMLDCMLNLSKAVFGPYEQNNEQEGLDDQIVNEQDNKPQEESVGGHPVLEASEKPLGKPFPRN